METRIKTKTDAYILKLKEDLKTKMVELQFQESEKTATLLEYLFEYEKLSFSQDDFVKRTRVQNAIPNGNRCYGKLADGRQCTRNKLTDIHFCGTHTKALPYGTIDIVEQIPQNQKIQVIAHEIRGIMYYLDISNNIYRTEDIVEGRENPRIIAHATMEEGEYHIPAFGI